MFYVSLCSWIIVQQYLTTWAGWAGRAHKISFYTSPSSRKDGELGHEKKHSAGGYKLDISSHLVLSDMTFPTLLLFGLRRFNRYIINGTSLMISSPPS